MNCPLIYCSSNYLDINVEEMFEIIIAKSIGFKPDIKEQHDQQNEAIIELDLAKYDMIMLMKNMKDQKITK